MQFAEVEAKTQSGTTLAVAAFCSSNGVIVPAPVAAFIVVVVIVTIAKALPSPLSMCYMLSMLSVHCLWRYFVAIFISFHFSIAGALAMMTRCVRKRYLF